MKESLCAKCSKGEFGGVSSCISPFLEEKDPGFWMTLSDIARIVKKTGLNPEEFCRFVEMEDDEEEDDELDDRHIDLMSVGDKNILMNGNKKCFFLGKDGCKIFDDRPKMCRIFPFWFKEKENNKIEITIQHENTLDEDECLITKLNYKNYDIPYLLSLINETEESMKKCIREYLEEMELHAKFKYQLEKKPMLMVLKDNGFIENNFKIKEDGKKNNSLPVVDP